MRRAELLGRVRDPQGRHAWSAQRSYAFRARTAMTCDDCHGPIEEGEIFSRPEINQRTQRFSRVYYCRRCVPFSQVDEGQA